MVEERRDSKKHLHDVAIRALKATIKSVLLYGIYFFLSMVMTPISEVVPSFQQIIEAFIIVYIILMVIGELSAGTIFQHFFNAARALFVILYLIFQLKGGIVGITYQNVNLIADLRLFMTIAILLSLLGIAKSVFQAINFMNEKAEVAYF